MGGTWSDRLLHRNGVLRPIWRIALFFFFFFLLAIPGQYVVSVLPRHPLQWGSLIAMLAAALVAGWIVLARFDRRAPGALGFGIYPEARREIVLGFGVGGALLGIAVLLLLATDSAAFTTDSGDPPGYILFLGWTLLFFAIAAAFEEAVFRGYPFQVLVEWIGAWPATLFGAGTFAFLHAFNPNVTPLALLNIFVAGVLLSIAYLKTRSLWFATSLHLGWNWSMASLVDFPVSGYVFDTPLYTAVPRGSALWTGGEFGPEAGIVGTIAITIGIIWLMRCRQISASASIRALRPIVEGRLANWEDR